MGRLIKGWEAIETRNEIRDAYRNGIDSSVYWKIRRDMNKKKNVMHFMPMRMDKPTPMFSVEPVHNSMKNQGLFMNLDA